MLISAHFFVTSNLNSVFSILIYCIMIEFLSFDDDALISIILNTTGPLYLR